MRLGTLESKNSLHTGYCSLCAMLDSIAMTTTSNAYTCLCIILYNISLHNNVAGFQFVTVLIAEDLCNNVYNAQVDHAVPDGICMLHAS